MTDLNTAYKNQLNRNSLHQLVPVHAYDDSSGLFFLEDGYLGFAFLTYPLAGCDDSLIQRLNVMFSLEYPADTFIPDSIDGFTRHRRYIDVHKRAA